MEPYTKYKFEKSISLYITEACGYISQSSPFQIKENNQRKTNPTTIIQLNNIVMENIMKFRQHKQKGHFYIYDFDCIVIKQQKQYIKNVSISFCSLKIWLQN